APPRVPCRQGEATSPPPSHRSKKAMLRPPAFGVRQSSGALDLPPAGRKSARGLCTLHASLEGETKSGEPQRGSGSHVRVARDELRRENIVRTLTPTGLCRYSPCPQGTTPLGLPISPSPLPRAARSSQPWAGGHNPFGIED